MKAHRILETNQRLSRSLLWQLERNYFNQQGVRAWSAGTVPHYVTSNPYIANAYGKVVFGFLRDCLQNQQLPLNPSQPVYIIEIGSGSGRFAYHFLKQFFDVYPHSPLQDIPVTFVMSDLAQQNLDFWQQHPRLHPFVEQGQLDFAQFDIESDRTFKLLISGEILQEETLKNPLIVFANYLFDSIPHDLFYIQNGQLYETLLTLTTANPEIADSSQLDDIEIIYTHAAVSADRYYPGLFMNPKTRSENHKFTSQFFGDLNQ